MSANTTPPCDFLSGSPRYRYYNPGYGVRFKQAREAKGRSLRQVMDDTGVHRGTISDIEHEKREPQTANRDVLAAYYGVQPAWLMTGTGSRMLAVSDMPEPELEAKE